MTSGATRANGGTSRGGSQMNGRDSLHKAIALAVMLLCPFSWAYAIDGDDRDGILYFEAKGFLPDGENDDRDIWDNDKGVRSNCFDDWHGLADTFASINNATWGSDDIDRVEITALSASDYGFDPNHEYHHSGDDVSCSEFESQWDEYSEPDAINLFVDGLTVESGNAGTEVKIDGAVNFSLFGDLTVEGNEDDPVVFTGTQWNGLDVNGVTVDLDHCEFTQAAENGAIRVGSGGFLQVNDCVFSGNEGVSGGAIRASDGALVQITDSVFDGNEARHGGAIYFTGVSPSPLSYLDNVTFEGNEAFNWGGGMYLLDNNGLDLRNLTFIDNQAGYGGAVAFGTSANSQTVRMWNPLIAGNSSRREGGGIHVGGSATVDLYNPTIAYNEGGNGGGLSVLDVFGGAEVTISNGIIAGNALRSEDGVGRHLYRAVGGDLNLHHVLMEGGATDGIQGTTNASEDVFDGEAGFRGLPDEAGEGGGSAQADWRLLSSSDGVNRGDGDDFEEVSISFGTIDVDGDGEDRIFGDEDPAIDLGAYEFPNNPPTLQATGDSELSLDETDEPVRLDICASYSDADIQPDFPNAERKPWLTRGPGDDEENLGGDAEEQAEDAEETADSGGQSGFGDVKAYDGGEAGDAVSSNNALDDPGGRAFYEPGNRSSGYEVTVQCRVRDELIDAEGEVDEDLSMFSEDSQTVTIEVAANNDVPEFQGSAETEGTVGRGYESEVTFSDPDADHASADLDVRIVDGPDWLSVRRSEDDEVIFEGEPDEEGEFDVEYEVVDPGGGTTVESTTITVETDEDLEPVTAGDDQSAEPGDQVRLSAEGPDEPGLLYEWRIEDDDGNEVASQQGQTYNWTAEEGAFTATVELVDGDEVVDDDSLGITVEAGFNGGVEEQEEREETSEEQEDQLDGMSEDGDADNQDDWDDQEDGDKAEALAELADADLTEEQQDAVLDEAEQVLEDATAGGEPVDEDLAEVLADTYGNLAGLELTGERQDAVIEGSAAVRDQAEEDGVAGAGVRSGLVRSAGGLLSQEDVTPERREAILEAADGDVAALDDAIADEDTPLDAEAAANAADSLGALSGGDLDEDRRATVRSSMEALRERAAEDGTGSDALTAGLVRGGAGLMASGDELSPEERNALLAGLNEDLATTVEEGGSLDSVTANRALGALGNASEAGEMGPEQVDQLLDGTANVVEATDDPPATQLTKAATVVGGLLTDREGRNLSDGQRAAVRELGEDLADAAMKGGEDINATGNEFFKVAATTISADTEGDALVGKESTQGPNIVLSEEARDELRQRNGIAEDGDLAFAIVATLRGPDASYVVEVFGVDSATGERLSDTSLEESVRMTIPVTDGDQRRPITVGGSPGLASNVDDEGQGVSFDTGEFATFTLTAEVDDSGERSDSDKASCFLDSVF